MSNRTAKILIAWVGVFCFLAFTYWLPIEEEAWGKQEDCLQSGEDSVLEHLKQKGWKHLEVFASEFMSIEEDGEVFMGKTVVIGKSKGKNTQLEPTTTVRFYTVVVVGFIARLLAL